MTRMALFQDLFEGDIVSVPYVDPKGRLHEETINYRVAIGFENGQFVELKSPESRSLVNWCKSEEGKYIPNYGNLNIVKNETVLEIIGNIWEHPDLLKGKQA